jgi:hypothetical protein
MSPINPAWSENSAGGTARACVAQLFSCSGRGPEGHEQLLKNSLIATSETLRDQDRCHVTAKSWANPATKTGMKASADRRPDFFNILAPYRSHHASGQITLLVTWGRPASPFTSRRPSWLLCLLACWLGFVLGSSALFLL